MVRHHHHDSSQLSMALFGGAGGNSGEQIPLRKCQGPPIEESTGMHQQPSGLMSIQEKRQRDWEAANPIIAGYRAEHENQPPPLSKAPDNPHRLGTFQHPFDRPKLPPDIQPQHHVEEKRELSYQQALQSQSGMELVPRQQLYNFPQAHPPFQQMLMPGTGYGSGSPVYVIMAPMNAGQGPLLDGIKQGAPHPQPPQSAQHMVLESLPTTSSIDTNWSTPDQLRSSQTRDPQNYTSKSLTRAKWGEKGVGVGHLWNPESSVNSPVIPGNTQSQPPPWADQTDGYTLPGGHKPGEKTHARGQPVVLDAQEMAEKQRRHRQAMETQRIIEQQLEEKKRQQEEEKEREKREAALWEEKLKEQREKEKNELEEEQKRKREKEEAEARRQNKIREAIEEAALRAKRDKETRLTRGKTLSPPKESEEGGSISAASDVPELYTPKENGQEKQETEHRTRLSTPKVEMAEERVQNEVSSGDKSLPSSMKLELSMNDLVTSAQLGNLDQMQKLALLRALGIAPEFLLSSGVFDKSSFMNLLGQSYRSTTPIIKEDGGEYMRNIIVTPTKFRRSRDFGVQCDEVVSDSYEERRASRRKQTRRQRGKETPKGQRTPKSSPEARPQWGKHKSERPYRKQSEKDPYNGRRLRRKTMRPLNLSGQESHTEESDPQTNNQPRRRRKTWDESRQESLSSDFSRSPSPKSRRGTKLNLPRGPPPIKPPLNPSFHYGKLPDSASSPHTNLPLSPTFATSGSQEDWNKNLNNRTEERNPDPREKEETEDDADVTVVVSPFRSNSPPVPALKGGSSFNIPEYPPGVDPDEIINRPLAKRKSTVPNRGNEISHLESNDVIDSEPPDDCERPITSDEVPQSPPLSAGRMRKSSLPSIYFPGDPDFQGSLNQFGQEENKPTLRERRSSLTSPPRTDDGKVPKINSVTRPCSKTSLSSNQQKLPPLSSQPTLPTSQDSPSPPFSPGSIKSRPPLPPAPAERSASPPVPAVQKRLLENLIRAKSVETLSLVGSNEVVGDEITPVEVTSRRSSSSTKLPSSLPVPPSCEFFTIADIKKKESCDSGVSELVSRPSSASSMVEEQLAISQSSSSYDSFHSSFKRPEDLTQRNEDQEKWIVLKSFSNIRENFWRKTQDLSLNPAKTKSST